MRELEDEDFERETVIQAASQVEKPPPVSVWWLLLPPVYYVLRRRRDQVFRERVTGMMRPEELESFAHLRDVASAWIFVAIGASLIAIQETWELHEQYDWADWTFWALVALMSLVCAGRVVTRIRRDRSPLSQPAD